MLAKLVFSHFSLKLALLVAAATHLPLFLFSEFCQNFKLQSLTSTSLRETKKPSAFRSSPISHVVLPTQACPRACQTKHYTHTHIAWTGSRYARIYLWFDYQLSSRETEIERKKSNPNWNGEKYCHCISSSLFFLSPFRLLSNTIWSPIFNWYCCALRCQISTSTSSSASASSPSPSTNWVLGPVKKGSKTSRWKKNERKEKENKILIQKRRKRLNFLVTRKWEETTKRK